MPSRRKSSKQVPELPDELRQSVINQTGVQDPSPTFVQDCYSNLEGGDYEAASQDDESNGSEDEQHTSLGVYTAAAQYPKPNYTLEALAGLDPDGPLAKQIVQQVLDIEDASPSMIHDIMKDSGLACARKTRSGAPSPEARRCGSKIYTDNYICICQCEVDRTDIAHCMHTEGEVTVLQHGKSTNDFVSGALSPLRKSRGSSSPMVVMPLSLQDAVARRLDWLSLVHYQPDGLLSLKILRDTELFSDEVLEKLPLQYHITVTGLLRAWDELAHLDGEEADDDMILNALFTCGGVIASAMFEDMEGFTKNKTFYAEDLVPYIGEGEEGYDAVF